MAELAINGGQKVFNGKFPMWPSFEESTIQKAMEPLRNGLVNYWTGKVGQEFEKAWAKWNGSRNAISVGNGTEALHTAVAALDIGAGDEAGAPRSARRQEIGVVVHHGLSLTDGRGARHALGGHRFQSPVHLRVLCRRQQQQLLPRGRAGRRPSPGEVLQPPVPLRRRRTG